jgi:hypothetical protein
MRSWALNFQIFELRNFRLMPTQKTSEHLTGTTPKIPPKRLFRCSALEQEQLHKRWVLPLLDIPTLLA